MIMNNVQKRIMREMHITKFGPNDMLKKNIMLETHIDKVGRGSPCAVYPSRRNPQNIKDGCLLLRESGFGRLASVADTLCKAALRFIDATR